jgi:DNA-binding MarR family transcriptional regulator
VGPQQHVRQTDYRDLAEFRYQLRRYLRFSEAAAREAGLEPQQHQLLLTLKGLPEHIEPTVRAIAERLQIQHQSAVGLVDRSVERGLVRRQRGGDDRRTVRVELTPEGDRILSSLSEVHQAELTSAAPALIRALYGLLSGGMDNEALDELVTASAHAGGSTQE